MTTNPFNAIDWSGLKTLFNNGIDSLLTSDSFALPCTIKYGDTKWTQCPNCLFDVLGQKSANKYEAGGPIPFPTGQICPYCNGAGRLAVQTTETVYLVAIWDFKDWVKIGSAIGILQGGAKTAEGYVQTMSKIDTYPTLKRAKSVVFDTNTSNLNTNTFIRFGEPNLCGLGSNRYVITMWEKSGG